MSCTYFCSSNKNAHFVQKKTTIESLILFCTILNVFHLFVMSILVGMQLWKVCESHSVQMHHIFLNSSTYSHVTLVQVCVCVSHVVPVCDQAQRHAYASQDFLSGNCYRKSLDGLNAVIYEAIHSDDTLICATIMRVIIIVREGILS